MLTFHVYIVMSEYKQVKIGKLKLKGASSSKHKKSKKKRKHDDGAVAVSDIPSDDDATEHGGWWSIRSFDKLNGGTVALQTCKTSYVYAVDNGTLRLGEKHLEHDEGPVDEEIFTMIRISDAKVAFKSGYGKPYLCIYSENRGFSCVHIGSAGLLFRPC